MLGRPQGLKAAGDKTDLSTSKNKKAHNYKTQNPLHLCACCEAASPAAALLVFSSPPGPTVQALGMVGGDFWMRLCNVVRVVFAGRSVLVVGLFIYLFHICFIFSCVGVGKGDGQVFFCTQIRRSFATYFFRSVA